MKPLISITDITEYLYCPRKVYLRMIKKVPVLPNKKMINGMLRHHVFDVFNKNEHVLVSGIKEKINESEIQKLYKDMLSGIITETITLNKNKIINFKIDNKELIDSINKTADPEISLRIPAVISAINSGFLGKELWKNLSPKYITELKLESPELGLRGRVDRVKMEDEILPCEIKTRDKIFESDKVQLAGYALLLEKEFGKPVSRGIIEIMGRQESIDLTEELKSKVLELAEKIRNLKEENASMPSSFNKCQSCDFQAECA